MTVPAWAPSRDKWPAGCTPSGKGWYRWFDGKTRYVCSHKVPLKDVEHRWHERRKEIEGTTVDASNLSYREALALFMTEYEARQAAGKRSIRTVGNYERILNNFGNAIGGGIAVRRIGPEHFTRFNRTLKDLKASSYKDVVGRVSAFFRWCAEMEYIDRYRPGPNFREPTKQEIRDDRVARKRAFNPSEIKRLLNASNGTMHLMILLGCCCAMNNSEVATLQREVVGLKEKLIDFQRRKTGKIRRLCPLPQAVADKLRGYVRPEPASPEYAGHFFLSELGTPYDTCASTISRLMRKVMESAGLTLGEGRNFAGLRTSFWNLCPSNFAFERDIIVGHARGSTGLDHYFETIDTAKLHKLVAIVWDQINNAPVDEPASKNSPKPRAAP